MTQSWHLSLSSHLYKSHLVPVISSHAPIHSSSMTQPNPSICGMLGPLHSPFKIGNASDHTIRSHKMTEYSSVTHKTHHTCLNLFARFDTSHFHACVRYFHIAMLFMPMLLNTTCSSLRFLKVHYSNQLIFGYINLKL
jgi:hypothetical protein